MTTTADVFFVNWSVWIIEKNQNKQTEKQTSGWTKNIGQNVRDWNSGTQNEV